MLQALVQMFRLEAPVRVEGNLWYVDRVTNCGYLNQSINLFHCTYYTIYSENTRIGIVQNCKR